jgi:transcriptional regulator with XRE-family HTH domain
MNDHTQRIIHLLQDKKMSATQFSEAIGIQRAAMSHITSGRNNPSADVITKIIDRFEDINPRWLLTGKGTMKVLPDRPPDDRQSVSEIEKEKGVSPSGRETDLFQTNTSAGDVIQTATQRHDEKRRPETVNQADNNSKIVEKEIYIYKDKPSKAIDKLIIFYSDHSYETFIYENNKNPNES